MSRYRECRLDWFTSRNRRRTLFGDIRSLLRCDRDVSVSAFGVALLEFGNPTPIERAWPFSAQHDRLIVVGDRFIEVAHLQVYEAATVECIRVVWPQTQRLIAIFQRLFELLPCPGQDRARPAAVVARALIVGLTLERLIATLDGVAIVGLVDQHRASPHIGADVVGIESDRLVARSESGFLL